MDPKELLSRFDRERRRDPSTLGTYEVEKTPKLTRLGAGSKSFILWSRIDTADLPATVEEEKAWASSHGRALVWKLYSHDGPSGLPAALAAAGFLPKPHETLMVLDLGTELPVGPAAPGLRVESVVDDVRFREYVAIDRGAFGAPPAPSGTPVPRRPVDPRVGLFLAYVDGTPAAIGRVEFEPGQTLAGLFGGGTSPSFRGRGIYRELLRTRVEWARARGARAMFTEAVDTTSRPILERLGFVGVAGIESWAWDALGPRNGPADSA